MTVYRVIMRLALPLLVAHLLWQRLTGRVDTSALAERLGRAGDPEPGSSGGPVLWLHGASNGELTSARWLVARLLAQNPDLRLVITCNTATARAMVRGWGLRPVQAVLAPFDARAPVARFLERWQPAAMLIVENELWPERLAQAAERMPVILIGARISDRSARIWGRVAPGLMRRMLETLSQVSAQNAASESRLLALGLPRARLLPRLMLKSRAGANDTGGDDPAPPFPCPVARARVMLAASTHEGEDAPILAAFAEARAAGVFDLLILAPRHPRRAAAVAALIASQGLPFARRSAGQVPGPDTAVYLADTLGEMPLWYAMAGATLIGGTLTDHGGHTPYEPAAYGSALIHGPHVGNFTESFAALDAAAAALALPGPEALCPALRTLTPADQSRLAAAARAVLTPEGDEAALLAAVTGALAR
ncbi:MAG TPA: glycosyltransferase N-terminal domain-containing protein [Paracoccaceae bacterium]